MTSQFVNPKFTQAWLGPARLAVVSLAAVIMAGDQAGAADARNERAAAFESRITGELVGPMMAIVSLRNQRITVYDAKGWIMRAPVSSGQKGRETPAGIFSVIEKQAEHYSNLYDDAYMPHMQRITWSGIALHGGPLPGYAASHGCVRMPYDFARHLFGVTKLGMRVIVAPTDVAPVEIVHPVPFPTGPVAGTVAAARAAEADAAATKADQARLATVTTSREAARAMMHVAENFKLGAAAQLAATDPAVASAESTEARAQAEEAKAKAAAKAAELEAQWTAAKAELQSRFDAVTSAREAAVTAENARVVAAEAARQAALDLEPVSVFISRKTQRVYIRQGFQPVLESPVTIRDADRPIGTHVFTAIERTGSGADMRWSVVSLIGRHPEAGAAEPRVPTRGGRGQVEPMTTDPGPAKEALDRIAIPQDALDRIAGIASPRSSLIISDEALSSETGKDTEFVVLMSGEPQGGIKFRRHGSETKVRHERRGDHLPIWPSPFAGPGSTR
jgi:pyruvate/2-oxoglutarate dehydrogenase complex dihydrolipoamide acyltransferase (E2) component